MIYLSLHCHHQNDSCIKMGRHQSHFKVSLIARDKITRQFPHTTSFGREKRAEADSNGGPSAYQPDALPLGQTGSRLTLLAVSSMVLNVQRNWDGKKGVWG